MQERWHHQVLNVSKKHLYFFQIVLNVLETHFWLNPLAKQWIVQGTGNNQILAIKFLQYIFKLKVKVIRLHAK